MSESSVYYDSDDDDGKKEDCALVDAVSELNFDEGNMENQEIVTVHDNERDSEEPSSSSSLNNFVEEEYDYLHDSEWINQRCQVFILSSAGKPVYSLHGSEEKLITMFGLLQALVSVVQSSDDSIRSISCGNSKFVFLVKNPLILVAVNKSKRSEQQILNQLM